MSEDEKIIRKQFFEIRSDFLNIVDLYERGHGQDALERARGLPIKLNAIVEDLARGYAGVLAARHLKTSPEIQSKIDTLMKKGTSIDDNSADVTPLLLK